jgi:hypothetical protein
VAVAQEEAVMEGAATVVVTARVERAVAKEEEARAVARAVARAAVRAVALVAAVRAAVMVVAVMVVAREAAAKAAVREVVVRVVGRIYIRTASNVSSPDLCTSHRKKSQARSYRLTHPYRRLGSRRAATVVLVA